MVFFIQMAVIVAIFYFIVLRPQRKQQKALEASLLTMTKGDEVVTAGGLIGEVIHVKESLKDGKPAQTMSDRVTMKTGESKVVVERGRIVVDPDLSVLGPVGFWLSNTLGPKLTLALGIAWPALLGTLGFFRARRGLYVSDLVG